MPKYAVWYLAIASMSVTVEADSVEEARGKANLALMDGTAHTPTLCHQCSGYSRGYELDLGEFEQDTSPDGVEKLAD